MNTIASCKDGRTELEISFEIHEMQETELINPRQSHRSVLVINYSLRFQGNSYFASQQLRAKGSKMKHIDMAM